MPHDFWWLALDALAVYRVSILVSEDKITGWLRGGIRDNGYQRGKDQLHPRTGRTAVAARWLYELVTCPWCVSVWAAAAAVVLTVECPTVWQYPAYGLALSGVAGFLAAR